MSKQVPAMNKVPVLRKQVPAIHNIPSDEQTCPIGTLQLCQIVNYILNGSQLAKMKKSIPDIFLP